METNNEKENIPIPWIWVENAMASSGQIDKRAGIDKPAKEWLETRHFIDIKVLPGQEVLGSVRADWIRYALCIDNSNPRRFELRALNVNHGDPGNVVACGVVKYLPDDLQKKPIVVECKVEHSRISTLTIHGHFEEAAVKYVSPPTPSAPAIPAAVDNKLITSAPMSVITDISELQKTFQSLHALTHRLGSITDDEWRSVARTMESDHVQQLENSLGESMNAIVRTLKRVYAVKITKGLP